MKRMFYPHFATLTIWMTKLLIRTVFKSVLLFYAFALFIPLQAQEETKTGTVDLKLENASLFQGVAVQATAVFPGDVKSVEQTLLPRDRSFKRKSGCRRCSGGNYISAARGWTSHSAVAELE